MEDFWESTFLKAFNKLHVSYLLVQRFQARRATRRASCLFNNVLLQFEWVPWGH
jgi:hypothetical protein